MADPKFIIDCNENGQLIVSDARLIKFWKTAESIQQSNELSNRSTFYNFPSEIISNSNAENTLEIIGVPFSKGSNFASSTVNSFPGTLRDLSNMTPIYMSLDSELTSGILDLNTQEKLLSNCAIDDLGDMQFDEYSVYGLEREVREYFRHIQKKGSKFAFIGGDHSITYYILKELKKRYDNILYIHFDAHLDCGSDPLRLDKEVNHGNFVRHLLQENIVKTAMQLGVRGLRSLGQYYEDPRLSVIPSAKLSKDSFRNSLNELYEKDSFIYVSFDVDILDPSNFSAVDYPSPGGPNISTIMECIQILGEYSNLIGIDFVEGRGAEVQEISSQYQLILNVFSHLLDALSKSQNKKEEK